MTVRELCQIQGEKEMALVSYKCPNCGGSVVFDPKKQKFCCEFCMSEFTKEEMEAAALKSTETSGTQEESSAADTAQNNNAGSTNQNEDALVYICPSCGAEVVTDATTAATFCYYCHNPVVLSGKLSGEFLPDYVIPFAMDKKKATGIYPGRLLLEGPDREVFWCVLPVPDVQLQGRRKDPGGRREEPDLGDGKYPLHGA